MEIIVHAKKMQGTARGRVVTAETYGVRNPQVHIYAGSIYEASHGKRRKFDRILSRTVSHESFHANTPESNLRKYGHAKAEVHERMARVFAGEKNIKYMRRKANATW